MSFSGTFLCVNIHLNLIQMIFIRAFECGVLYKRENTREKVIKMNAKKRIPTRHATFSCVEERLEILQG